MLPIFVGFFVNAVINKFGKLKIRVYLMEVFQNFFGVACILILLIGGVSEMIRQNKEKKKKQTAAKTREKRKNNLIKKYGKEDGMMIFKRKISEKNYLLKTDFIKKYGDEFGSAVFSKKVLNDMTPKMVIDSIGDPKYKDSDNKRC